MLIGFCNSVLSKESSPFTFNPAKYVVATDLLRILGSAKNQVAIYKPDANSQLQYVETVTYEENLKRLASDILSDREEDE